VEATCVNFIVPPRAGAAGSTRESDHAADASADAGASALACACADADANAPADADANALADACALADADASAHANAAERSTVMSIELQIHLHSYIAHPYWPEMEQLINIQKESGMNRARSSANRRKALEEHLKTISMTLGDYDNLVRLAERPFHTDPDGRVVIPKANVDAMLVATCDTIRAAGRPCPPDLVRTVLRASGWTTDISAEAALEWRRFAVVSAGTGAKLSNQRGLRVNRYVGAEPPAEVPATDKVLASGTLDPNPEMVRPEVLRSALVYAGEWVGIGASRKMGWGRFSLLSFEEG